MAVYKFNDVFEDATKKGKKIPTNQYLLEGKYPIIDQGKEDIGGYTNTEDGLFTNVPAIIFGDHTRIIKYVDMPFFIGADGVKILEKKVAEADYKYLFYTLNHAYIPDTGYNRHFKFLKEISITIPDIVEQRKIVQQLDLLSSMIDKQLSILEIYDNLVKSRFIEIFGDPVINDKGWPKDKLKNHADVIVGYPFASSQYTADGLPIVGGYNLMQGFVQWENSKFWPSPEGYEQYLLKDKDIVIAMDRPWVGSGFKIAIIEKADLPAILIQRTACIRCKDIPTQFLYRLLDSAWFADHCQITGSLVPHISNKDILNYEIIVPPLDLQNQFADFVALTDKSKLAVQQSIETLQTLKAKLMQDYFG